MIGEEFNGKCPICNKSTKLIYITKDGKAKFYQCKNGHVRAGRKQYPVIMVEEKQK
jgi:ssDNA-binding Zn-finger/Zn-ribbon topoisomerase 1